MEKHKPQADVIYATLDLLNFIADEVAMFYPLFLGVKTNYQTTDATSCVI